MNLRVLKEQIFLQKYIFLLDCIADSSVLSISMSTEILHSITSLKHNLLYSPCSNVNLC